MVNQREARITMDYVTGMTVGQIAEREGVTTVRVYQVLHKVAYRVLGFTSIKYVKAEDMPRLVARLHEIVWPHRATYSPGEACTPKEFYQELMSEKKTRNYE
jgi:NAD/NADP transhydrogenase beta subunit